MHIYMHVLYTPQSKFDYFMNKCNDLNSFKRHAKSVDFAVCVKIETGHQIWSRFVHEKHSL